MRANVCCTDPQVFLEEGHGAVVETGDIYGSTPSDMRKGVVFEGCRQNRGFLKPTPLLGAQFLNLVL